MSGLVSECLEHPGEYNGKPAFKWLCYVIDRKDGKIKPYFMPHTVYKQVEGLQTNPDDAFDEVPMPYDITINAAAAGDIKVKYTVVPARNNTPLTPGEQALLRGTQPIRQFQAELQQAGGEAKGQVNPQARRRAGRGIQHALMKSGIPATIQKVETMARYARIVVDTQENITPEQLSDLFTLHDAVGWFFFVSKPLAIITSDMLPDIPNIQLEEGEKSPSQRLRAVLYIYWQQNGSKNDFDLFYRRWMERAIDAIKEKPT